MNDRVGARLPSPQLAIGTARGDEDDLTDARMATVLRLAIDEGVRIIDTAVNYRRGRSEKVVGEAVRAAAADGAVKRDDIIVITKGGFLRPPCGPTPARPLPERHDPPYHCLSPACLRHQIDLSLATLNIGPIDCYLLHNPEMARDGRSDAAFDRLMLGGFELLEQTVADGKIRGYGMATWRPAGDAPDAPGIARCKALAAQAAGGADHFKLVQAPLSLSNQRALSPTHVLGGRSLSLPDICRELGIAFVASAAAGGGVAALAIPSVRWVMSVPHVTAALFGTIEPDHARGMIAANQMEATCDG